MFTDHILRNWYKNGMNIGLYLKVTLLAKSYAWIISKFNIF